MKTMLKRVPALSALLLLLVAGGVRRAAAQQPNNLSAWKPAPAPLMTRWAKTVRPENPRPEYPRPLLVRNEWKSLNGPWEFAFDDKNEGRAAGWSSGKTLGQQILVPFTFEAALSGVGKNEIHERVWYRRSFAIPKSWSGKRTQLHFGAVDWETTVWVNGREIGAHRGGYAPFSFDITSALKPSGLQEIVVAVFDPADPKKDGVQPKGKQLGSRGIWYTRTTGIWQSVWLEPTAAVHLRALRADADPATGVITVHADVAGGQASQISVAVSGPDNAKKSMTARTVPVGQATYALPPLPRPRLWSPESPTLYDVTVRIKDANGNTDEVKTYVAFRAYGIKNGRLTLNGQPLFLRGVLDQGYWPDGVYTAPSDEALRFDVEMTKKMGFNLARKHVKVEDPRWYYWCDRLGLLVWQDMPSSHNLSGEAAKQIFRDEWREVVETVRGYPSVVHWIPFNENWGAPGAFQDEIVSLTRTLDVRPITDASGWTQRALTDVTDVHDYGNNLKRQGVGQAPVKPKVVGEWGGIALPIKGHTWTEGWGYQKVASADDLLQRIRFQATQLFEAPHLSGFVYTQLSDVEQEMNGLLTYDRLPKADVARIARVFSGQDRADLGGYVRDWIVLGPIQAGTKVHSTLDGPENRAVMNTVLVKEFLENEAAMKPTDNLLVVTPDDNQRAWHLFRAPSDVLDLHDVFDTKTDNAVAYAVAYIDAPTEMKNVTLRFGSDDAALVWLNGREIHRVNRVRGVSPDEDAVKNLTLIAGQNVLIVKIAQGIGGWGLIARFEKSDGTILRPSVSAAAKGK